MLPVLVFCMVGLPIPNLRVKQSVERFPCEACTCSCTDPHHCWDKCCCHTDEEKLDWAKENDVVAPDFLVARVAAKRALVAVIIESKCKCCSGGKAAERESKVTKTCCGSPAKEKGICSTDTPASKSCCSTSCCSKSERVLEVGDSGEHLAESATETNSTPKPRVLLLESAFKCLGIQAALMLFKNAISPSASEFGIADPYAIGTVEVFDQVAVSIYLDLDGPVPKII